MIAHTYRDSLPHKARVQSVEARLRVWDTPLSSASLGIVIKIYDNPTQTGDPVVSGYVPNIFYFWDQGVPAGLTETDDFSIVFEGYFYADSGTVLSPTLYDFLYGGVGLIKMQLWDNSTAQMEWILGSAGTGENTYINISDKDINESGRRMVSYCYPDAAKTATNDPLEMYATGGQYSNGGHQFQIVYRKDPARRDSGLVVMWRDNNENYDPRVLSAGHVMQLIGGTPAFLSSTTLVDINNIELDVRPGSVDSLSFRVPLTANPGTIDLGPGYYFDDNSALYQHTVTTAAKIRPYDLITYEISYDGSTWVERFRGNIAPFKSARAADGEDSVTITAYGFMDKVLNTINENFPSPAHYIAAFAGDPPDSVRLQYSDRSPCFDGWPLHAAAKVLLLQAGIDSSLVANRKQHWVDSAAVSGETLIEQRDAVLDMRDFYGTAFSVPALRGTDRPDDRYVWQFAYGSTIADILGEMTESYGYDWGFNRSGQAFLRAKNNPRYINADEFQNHVPNPGVEKKVAGDRQAGGLRTDDEAHTGFWSWKCSAAGDGLYVSADKRRYTYGRSYTFSAWVKSTTGTSATSLRIEADSTLHPWNETSLLDVTTQSAVISGAMAWTRYSVTVTSQTDEPAKLKLVLSSTPSPGTVYLDDLQVEQGSLTTFVNPTDDLSNEVNALKATLRAMTDSTETLSINFRGARVDLITEIGPACGDAADVLKSLTWEITESDGSTQVATGQLNLYASSTQHYFDGFESAYGSYGQAVFTNPCVFTLLNSGAFKSRILKLTPVVNGGSIYDIKINAVALYDVDISAAVDTLYVGYSGSNRSTVGSLQVDWTTGDVRNDVIVLGTTTGRAALRTDLIINENNPLYTLVYARATDTDSLYTNTASNYQGRPNQLVVIDSKITDDARAKWMATDLLRRYRVPQKVPVVQSIGHPLLELHDALAISDVNKEIIASTDIVWLTHLNENYAVDSTYTAQYEFAAQEPYPSYEQRQDPDVDIYPIQNVVVSNRGIINTLAANITAAATSITLNDATGIPSEGYLKIEDATGATYEWIRYTSVSGNILTVPTSEYWWPVAWGRTTGRGWLDRTAADGSSTTAQAWSAGDRAIVYFCPYQQEEAGLLPTIDMDVFYSGNLKVDMQATRALGTVLVAILTRSGGSDTDWMRVDAGSYSFAWDCRDEFGRLREGVRESNDEVARGVNWYILPQELERQGTEYVVVKPKVYLQRPLGNIMATHKDAEGVLIYPGLKVYGTIAVKTTRDPTTGATFSPAKDILDATMWPNQDYLGTPTALPAHYTDRDNERRGLIIELNSSANPEGRQRSIAQSELRIDVYVIVEVRGTFSSNYAYESELVKSWKWSNEEDREELKKALTLVTDSGLSRTYLFQPASAFDFDDWSHPDLYKVIRFILYNTMVPSAGLGSPSEVQVSMAWGFKVKGVVYDHTGRKSETADRYLLWYASELGYDPHDSDGQTPHPFRRSVKGNATNYRKHSKIWRPGWMGDMYIHGHVVWTG